MQAVTREGDGGTEVLRWSEVDDPTAGPGEVVIDVEASAVNRADLLQRMGFYPPPPGASEIIGLECSGVIRTLGAGVTDWKIGDPVCALLAGGGYAEQVAVPVGQVMPIPRGVSLVDAAGLPEVVCTVWSNLVMRAHLSPGESVLLHGGSSGIGTMAIQISKAIGASPIIVTAGSSEKLNACKELGSTLGINYNDEDFAEVVREETDGHGVDVILDLIGAKYLAGNINAMANDGRLVVIGMQGGMTAEINLGELLRKRGALHATSLRARPLDQKAAICRSVVENVWLMIEAGDVRPVIDWTVPMDEVARAHDRVEEGSHIGKVLLRVP